MLFCNYQFHLELSFEPLLLGWKRLCIELKIYLQKLSGIKDLCVPVDISHKNSEPLNKIIILHSLNSLSVS